MRQRRKFSREFKAEAVKLVREGGARPREVRLWWGGV
jgi:transposase-like protein